MGRKYSVFSCHNDNQGHALFCGELQIKKKGSAVSPIYSVIDSAQTRISCLAQTKGTDYMSDDGCQKNVKKLRLRGLDNHFEICVLNPNLG